VALGLFLMVLLALWQLSSFASEASSPSDPPAPVAWVYLPAVSAPITNTPVITHSAHLPLVYSQPYECPSTSTAPWNEMSPRASLITGASRSPDLNMNVRGWYPVAELLGFVQYPYPPDAPPDTEHPLHLSNIAGSTAASFVRTYQVNDWDWLGCNCPVSRNPSPYPVTMLGLRTIPSQPLHIASRDRPVDPRGYTAMVLYAEPGQIALKYTWDDRVDDGYLVHLVNLCVDPNLVALYQRLDAADAIHCPRSVTSA
jgi:hypothetical protein